jgi:ankyrin repeat protein
VRPTLALETLRKGFDVGVPPQTDVRILGKVSISGPLNGAPLSNHALDPSVDSLPRQHVTRLSVSYHQVFSLSLMSRYHSTDSYEKRATEDNVVSVGDTDPDYAEADEDEFATQGQALISAILEYAPIEDVQKLLDDDAPLWYQDEDGWSALHAAASVEDAELVKMLLQHGALWNSGKLK